MSKQPAPLQNILSRLDGVRETPGGFKARCPAHDDQNPSLNIGEGDDGRVLLKCWAGCEALDIVKALGLELADLYERNYDWRQDKHKRQVPRLNWRDSLQLLFHDATVVKLCSEKIKSGESLTDDDLKCLEESYLSISAVVSIIGALEMPRRVAR